MAVQAFGNASHFLPVSASDQEALALLISLRDNPEIQKDNALFKMFNDAVSFMLTTGSSPASLITFPSAIPQALRADATQSSLTTSEISSASMIKIDTSGENGDNGLPGTAASVGGYGFNGTDAADGGNARDINLKLMAMDGIVTAHWDSGNASMKLGNVEASIFLRAVGGKGGKGGGGGKGGLGTQGARGRNATQSSQGANGNRGTPGLIGGKGGDGGSGGKGGGIRVFVSPEDSDLLMLLNTPEVAGGGKGKGGSKGNGGIGGKGGEGGSSCSWTQTVAGTRTVPSGRGGFQMQPYTYSVSRFSPGGSPGPQGFDGDDGCDGTDGKIGVKGSFQMIVGGMPYQRLYDLAITVSKVVDLTVGNPADIYEPGEHVNLMVSVFNTGGMPTPFQDIEVSLRPAECLEQRNSSLILNASDCLAIDSSHTFPTHFSFRVKDRETSIEDPLNRQEELTYRALLLRVNKFFPHVSQQKDLFSIKYPVQISSLHGRNFTTINEISTLSLFIQNITSISMGIVGPQKRRVFVTFEIAKQEDVNPSDVELLKTEASDLQEPNKITMEVDHLPPKDEKKLSVAFRFTNPNQLLQIRVEVIASLYLDYFNSGNDRQPNRTRCIQNRTIHMQLSKK